MRSERVNTFWQTFKDYRQEGSERRLSVEEAAWVDLLADPERNATASGRVDRLLDRTGPEWNDKTLSFCMTLPGTTARPKVKMDGRNINASRLVYVVKQCWPIDSSTQIRHLCDNHRCLNPEHLQHGDWLDNEGDKRK